MLPVILQLFFSFLLSLGLTAVVRHLSTKHGKLALVRDDRWHKTPVPLLGGIAIWLSWFLVSLFTVPPGPTFFLVLAGGTAIFILGLTDDFVSVSPQAKLIVQLVVAVVMIKGGIYVTISPYPALNIPLTILWIVGITNAFNLLDNMDGLSAGIASISAAVLLFFSLYTNMPEVAILTAPLIGAALGFLRYNFNPAKIFMGDCGSMFLGFTLAVLSILGTWRHASNLIVTMSVPMLILAIPIFDTTFVTITRKIAGKPLSEGGRDHLSHKLVALGLSERQAVLWLYSISIFAGFFSVFFATLNPTLMLVGFGLVAVPLYFLGVFLGEIEVHARRKEQEERSKRKSIPVRKKKVPFSRKTVVEMLMDILLFTIAFSSAYYIKYDSQNITLYHIETAGSILVSYFDSLPWVVLLKCIVFYFSGLYRSIWRYVGIREMIDVIKAVTISTVLIVFISVLKFDFAGISRTLFIIDWMSTLLLVGGSRFLLRALKELFSEYQKGSKRVLLVGADDGADVVLRELRNNNMSHDYNVVGLIDDNPKNERVKIHNVPVVGTVSTIPEITQRKNIVSVLIALPLSHEETIKRVIGVCNKHGIPYERVPVMNEALRSRPAETP